MAASQREGKLHNSDISLSSLSPSLLTATSAFEAWVRGDRETALISRNVPEKRYVLKGLDYSVSHVGEVNTNRD